MDYTPRFLVSAYQRAPIFVLLCATLPVVLSGCTKATLDGKLFQNFGPDGTSILGGVTYLLSRDQMEKGGADAEHKFVPMYQDLRNNGFTDEELMEGKVVIVLYQWYRHNPSRVHDVLDWAVVKAGLKVNKDDIVEIHLRKPYAIVNQVLYHDQGKGECEFVAGERGGLAVLDMMAGGGPATANLYCPKLEQEGWGKTPFGMYKGGFIMTKPPKT